jgi:hypothetical protein
MESMRLSFGRGGWVAIDGLGHPGVLYLRFRDVNHRLRIVEFYLDGSRTGEAIDAQDLVAIPLGSIEAQVNAYFADAVRHDIGRPAPDLSTLASYFNRGLGGRGPTVRAVLGGNWVVAGLAAQNYVPADKRSTELSSVMNGEELRVTLMRVGAQDLPPAKEWSAVEEAEREFRLTERPQDGLTDEFLRSVARAYNAAVARGERPNASIREQLDVPLKTVQRWVYTARQRSIMEPSRRAGAAG